MTDLQKEFEATGYTSWINADLYPDGKIYTQEYARWLERQVLAARQPPVSGSLQEHKDVIRELINTYIINLNEDGEPKASVTDIVKLIDRAVGLIGTNR